MSNNWLFKHLLDYLRWSVSVYKKLTVIVPGYTITVAIAALVAQITLLLAFFLPIKILLLIGSPGVPHYFPQLLLDYGRDILAFYLGIAAVGSYILNLIANRVYEVFSARGTEQLLQRSRKLTMFARQEEIAKQAYQKFSGTMASLMFTVLGITVIALIYTPLSLYIILLLLLYLVVLTMLTLGQTRTRSLLLNNVSGTMDVLAAILFLSTFVYIVIDLVNGDEFKIISAVIALLITRQIAQRLSSTVKDAIALTRQKPQINALFFHGKALDRTQSVQTQGFWSLLEPSRRKRWLLELMREITEPPLENIDTAWHQTGPRGVVGLDVITYSQDSHEKGRFFVKLFDARHKAQATHEASLLGERWAQALPAPVLLSITIVEDYQCLIFNVIPDQPVRYNQLKEIYCDLLRKSWSTEPPEPVVNRYRRSMPFLVDRLNQQLIGRLRIATSNREQERLVNVFESELSGILDILSAIPLFIHNPNIISSNVNIDPDGNAVITHWGMWSLEPVGAGWPIQGEKLDLIADYLDQATAKRRLLSEVHPRHARLAALIFAFEHHCLQENYPFAIDLLPEILVCLDTGAESGESGPIANEVGI